MQDNKEQPPADSNETDSDEQSLLSDSGCDGGMPGAWPEWSEAEDEQRESETEEFETTERK